MDDPYPLAQDREWNVLGSQKNLIMKRFFIILWMVSMTFACGIFDTQLDGEATPTQDLKATLDTLTTQYAACATQVQEQATAVVLATYVPYLSTQIGNLRLTPTPTESVVPTVSPLLPLSGLVYSSSGSLWQIAYDGSLIQLSDRSDVVLSPDGNFALFTQEGPEEPADLWIIDLSTGEESQLTNTPERIELFGLWWPGQPDKVIVGSISVSEERGYNTGHLSIVSVETDEYLILDEENISNTFPAPSPDGQRIAHDRGGSPWIYDLVKGPEFFDATRYGVTGSNELTFASPAWSPDGKQLAWLINGRFDEGAGNRMAFAIFDLATGTSKILHPYYPINPQIRGWPPAPVWSPNGQWLALNAWSQENAFSLWAIKVDGSEEHDLVDGYNPLWSPDGSKLIFTGFHPRSSIWLVQVNDWKKEQVNLLSNSTTKAWFPPDE
jgi:Tol biopolymer transport system component